MYLVQYNEYITMYLLKHRHTHYVCTIEFVICTSICTILYKYDLYTYEVNNCSGVVFNF